MRKTQRTTEAASPEHLCKMQQDWDNMTKEYINTFGARVFLIKNLEIKKIPGSYVIDFDTPDRDAIPDIWNERYTGEHEGP